MPTHVDDTGVLPRTADPADLPPPPKPAADPDTEPIRRTCGCCGSRLDRRGNVIERGPRWADFLESDDKLREATKQLADEKIAHDDTRRQLTNAKTDLAKHRARRFGHTD